MQKMKEEMERIQHEWKRALKEYTQEEERMKGMKMKVDVQRQMTYQK